MRVAHQGNSSVRYEIALFRNDERIAAAQGRFIHVYVDRLTRRPVPLPDSLRAILEPLKFPRAAPAVATATVVIPDTRLPPG
jgi:acyl-CoA thioester hydrolase